MEERPMIDEEDVAEHVAKKVAFANVQTGDIPMEE